MSVSQRPTILVSNDDGYASPGIVALAHALTELGNVVVVAPADDQSGVGHRVTVNVPVRVRRIDDAEVTTFAVEGTPADCAVLGAYKLCDVRPALCVSGINRGANLADDTFYSGTVAAALEATSIGIPSIAVSLATFPGGDDLRFAEAAQIAVSLAREVLAEGLPHGTLLNVNVPYRPESKRRGLRWCRLGRKIYRDRVTERADPRGDTYYWLWGSFNGEEIVEGTDLAAVRDGYTSVTPMTLDRTDHDELGRRWRAQNADLRT